MIDIRGDLQTGEYVIFSSTHGKGGLCRYWGNNLTRAKQDMQDLWKNDKGGVYYLFKLERVVKAGDYPTIQDIPPKVERVTLEKQNDEWRIK
jgi:hypothetical protein